MQTPPQILFVAIEPHTGSDEEKLAGGLRTLIGEDPSAQTYRDAPSGATIVRGVAELQLEMMVDRLRREFQIEMTVGRPQVIYRGTATRVAEGEGRYLRTMAGRNQYAHAKVRLFPREAGAGYIFVNHASGLIPEEFIQAVDEGIRESLSGGILAGYTVEDVRVELSDGSYHERDSSETAFRIAGALAFRMRPQKPGRHCGSP